VRALLLAAVLIAGVARADDRADRSLATFASHTALYLLRLDSTGTPHCEEWRTVPSPERGRGRLVHDDLKAEYQIDQYGELDVCGYRAAPREQAHGNELDIAGARWFRDPRGCASALTHHRRVATDFAACTGTRADEATEEASKARLQAIIQAGGDLATRDDDRCIAVPVSNVRAGRPAGQVVVDRLKVTHSWDYAYDVNTDRFAITNDHYFDKPSATVFGTEAGSDYQEYAFFSAGTVLMAGESLFWSAQACTSFVAIGQRKAQWLPPNP
jgi:hypothetical protein